MKENHEDENYENYHGRHYMRQGNRMGGGAVYFFGFIGAAIFFVGQTATFGTGVLGFLKAIVWPVFIVYEALKFLIK